MLGLDFIVKAALGLVALFVVLGLIYALVPDAMKEYIDNTALGKIIPNFSIGLDKYESDFQIPKEIKENIEQIDSLISKEKDWELQEGEIKTIELNDFTKDDMSYKIIIKKDYYIVENMNGQRAYYENDLTAIPCAIHTSDPNYMSGLLDENKYEKKFVDSITLKDKNTIQQKDDEYAFLGLTKESNSICFVYFSHTGMNAP